MDFKAARGVQHQAGDPDVPLKGVQLDLTMTLPPRVSVSFVNNVVRRPESPPRRLPLCALPRFCSCRS